MKTTSRNAGPGHHQNHKKVNGHQAGGTAPVGRYHKKPPAPAREEVEARPGSTGQEARYDRAAVLAQLSAVRLEPYLAATGGDPEGALALYVWNARMAAALFEEIHYAEVFLRNALAAALEVIVAANPGLSGHWYDQGFLDETAFSEIAKAREKLIRRNAALTEGRIIAELPLGFWQGLIVNHDQRLWERGLYRAFPDFPTSAGNEHLEVGVVIHGLCELRNRIAHHEPIFRRDQAADHCLITDLIGWISADARSWIEENGRVLEVSCQRPAVLEQNQ
jgi:hypothetical protein